MCQQLLPTLIVIELEGNIINLQKMLAMLKVSYSCLTNLMKIHLDHILSWLKLLKFYLFYMLSINLIVLLLLLGIYLHLELIYTLQLQELLELYMVQNMVELMKLFCACCKELAKNQIYLNSLKM